MVIWNMRQDSTATSHTTETGGSNGPTQSGRRTAHDLIFTETEGAS
jgi:hypothetical protein